MFRPTFNIRGIQSGKVLKEAKTIIPSEVIADFDIRLVPNQKSTKIKKIILNHFEELKKENKRFEEIIDNLSVEFQAAMEPWKTDMSSKWTKVIVKSVNDGFQKESIRLPLLGGSLPLEVIKNELQIPTYLIPYAQPDENNHGPNENIMISWFNSGVKSTINLLNNLNYYNNNLY